MTQSREPEPQSRRKSTDIQFIEPALSETLDSYIKRLQDQYCEPLQQATLELTAALAQLQHYAHTHELPNQAQFSIDDQALHNSCLYTLNRCISLLQKQHQEAARPHLQQINTDADIRMQSIGDRLR